jgi:hypothetical protein
MAKLTRASRLMSRTLPSSNATCTSRSALVASSMGPSRAGSSALVMAAGLALNWATAAGAGSVTRTEPVPLPSCTLLEHTAHVLCRYCSHGALVPTCR